jgi:hypothetical protein
MGPAPQPWVTTVTIDGEKFGADSVSVGFSTQTGPAGLPLMGTLHTSIDVVVDLHDDVNMPFATLRKLFDLAKTVTRDKVKDVKLEFWKDEKRQDAVCVYSLQGWISHFQVQSGGGGNHTLVMSIQPTLDPQSYPVVDMSN